MSLKHAILGFLEFGPRTGYDLKKGFDRSVANFWPAQHSQIYGTLARMEQDGLATMKVEPQDGRPDRKVYTITEEGRRELHEWLLGDISSVANKSAYQVQTFFLSLLTQEERVAVLQRRIRSAKEVIADLQARVPKSDAEATARSLDPCEFYTFLTVDFAIERAKFHLRWLTELLAKVERGDPARGARAAFERDSDI